MVQGTRYYEEDDNRARLAARLASLRQTDINERIENHMVLCGTPDMVIDEIKALHDELGHGVMNINMKIGNIPDDAVRDSMTLWCEYVAPQVRGL